MKKEYINPKMEIITMDMSAHILSDSDNPWWVPPDEKEGCETPWWCP